MPKFRWKELAAGTYNTLFEKANEMAHRQGFAGSVASKRSTPSALLPVSPVSVCLFLSL